MSPSLLSEVFVCLCAVISAVCLSSCVLALRPCVNVIFKPEKGEERNSLFNRFPQKELGPASN